MHLLLSSDSRTVASPSLNSMDSLRMVDSHTLWTTLGSALDHPGSDDGQLLARLASAPPPTAELETGDAFYLGPLAMLRHPLCRELAHDRSIGLTARLLAAQLLDLLAVIALLEAVDEHRDSPPKGRLFHAPGGDSVGVGMAITARGPVLHIVSQDASARELGVASDWRIIAPTDWHFTDGRLLGHLLSSDATGQEAALALAALDPCCASDVVSGPIKAVHSDA
jgi:hypothetical protein